MRDEQDWEKCVYHSENLQEDDFNRDVFRDKTDLTIYCKFCTQKQWYSNSSHQKNMTQNSR